MDAINSRSGSFEVIDILSDDEDDTTEKRRCSQETRVPSTSRNTSIHEKYNGVPITGEMQSTSKYKSTTCTRISSSNEKKKDVVTVDSSVRLETYSSESTNSSIDGIVPVEHFSKMPVPSSHHGEAQSVEEKLQPMVNGVSSTMESASHFTDYTEEILEHFINSLTPLMKEEKEKKIVCKIRSLASRCNPSFVNSQTFKDLVHEKVASALKNKDKVFLFIKDVYDTIKSYKKPKTTHSAAGSEAVTVEYNGAHGDHQENSVPHDTDKQRATEASIVRLEKLLAKLDHRIRHLQQKELSLNEMEQEDSSYILEDRYKRRFCKVWEKLCELKGRTPSTGRHIEKKVHFEGTRYPEINKQIEKSVNDMKKNSRNSRFFPDHKDILTIVEGVNKSDGLNLTSSEQHMIAREAFEDVAKALIKRRQRDEKELFGCFLTDDVEEDPAENDPRLQEQLQENDRVASTIEEVIARYAERQGDVVAEEVLDEDVNSSPSRQDDDEEDIENQELMETNVLHELEGVTP